MFVCRMFVKKIKAEKNSASSCYEKQKYVCVCRKFVKIKRRKAAQAIILQKEKCLSAPSSFTSLVWCNNMIDAFEEIQRERGGGKSVFCVSTTQGEQKQAPPGAP